jgi:hypothetical protein
MLVRDFPYLRDIKRKESLAVSPPPENPFEGRIQRVPL